MIPAIPATPGRRAGLAAAPLLFLFVCACGALEVGKGTTPKVCPAPAPEASVELVESVPLETSLDHARVADAPDVWRAMIDGATQTLDLAEFYASEAEPASRASSRLAPIVEAIERARARGVRIRFLADAKFAKQYPETLDRLAASGVVVRRLDVEARTGGVLHAKYFVVDGALSFVGSQNFDWRALAHIQELGVRVRSPSIAGALLDLFETDWAIAGGAPDTTRVHDHGPGVDHVASTHEQLTLVASPKGWLPDERTWDLPRLITMLDGAQRAIALQLLTYKTKDRAGQPFTTLDEALRRAAARGVHVSILISEWGAKGDGRRALEDLASLPNVEVRVITIPRWSGGEIPFARVAHAKYLVVDAVPATSVTARAWVGTSNWEGDYFFRSRNVGVVVDGGALPPQLREFFDQNWTSPYTAPLGAPLAPAPLPAATSPADAGPP